MTSISVDFDEFQINVETQEQGPAGTGITWKGAYSGVTAYVVNDSVSYLGSSYICILASTNNLPTNATYWNLMASKGDNGTANITTSTATDISGLLKGASGFIAQAISDTDYLTPTTAGTTYVAKNVAIIGATKTKITYDAKGLVTSGTDATTTDIADSTDRRYLSDAQKTEATRNASGLQNGLLSSTDWTTFNSKQEALGFTPENVANKENTTLDTSTTKYPTNRLVKEYADSLVVGLLDYRGGYDASVNTFPTTGGSGPAGAVLKGNMWVLSVAGTLGGSAVQVGDSIIASVDTPGQTAGNWNILNSNVSYVPEDQANKETSALDTSVTKYPCNNVVKSAIEARYAILEDKTSDYAANSTNSGKMWMRGDLADGTIKGVIKTTVNDSYTYSVFDSGTRRILSNGNLTATHNGDGPSGWETAKSSIGKSSGKWYWEVSGTFSSSNATVLGIVNSTANLISNYFPGLDANGYGYVAYDTTIRFNGGNLTSGLATYTTNDVMGFALDMDSGTLKFYKNNVLQYTVTGLTGTWYAAVASDPQTPLAILTANFGATSMVYTAPAGYNQGLFDFASNIVYTNEQFPTKAYTDSLISDVAYDATSWNGITTIAPSKNAIRDKIESIDLDAVMERGATASISGTMSITSGTGTGGATSTISNWSVPMGIGEQDMNQRTQVIASGNEFASITQSVNKGMMDTSRISMLSTFQAGTDASLTLSSSPSVSYAFIVSHGIGGTIKGLNSSTAESGIKVYDQQNSKGLVGVADFSSNYDSLTYVQKVYADTKVPYTGATQNVDIGEYSMSVSKLHLDNTPTTGTLSDGDIYWNVDDKTANLVVDSVNGVNLNIGQENYIRGVNKTGVQINDGQVVYINLTQGNRPKIVLARADSFSTSTVIGVATQNIADNAEGFVTTFGVVHGYNTSGFTAGDSLYLSASTAGLLTNVMPTTPNYNVVVGKALDSTNNGHIFVSPEMPIGMDGTLVGNSDKYSVSEKAVKTYVDTATTESALLSKLTVFADSKNGTGFFDNTNISVSYDKTTRTVTLTRGGGVVYYFQGKKYTLTSPWTSSAHTNSSGNYFLYSTDGVTFSWSTTPWIFDNIMVAMVMYDGADGWAIREVHGLMDVEAHINAHNNIGTWRSSGGLLTAGTYTENTASDAANSPGFDSAIVNDEDIATTIPAWTEGTYTTMYIGASSTATFSTVATLPFVSAGSYLQVNNPATGTMTDGIKNRFYNVYQILVPSASDSDSQKRRMIMLQPQATFTSLASAQAEDPRSLSLGNFATTATEFTIYARITYATSVGDANTGKCRIATGGVSYVIGNRLSSSSLTGSPTNHAGLTNLSWNSSGHTGSNLGAPLFDATGIATQVVPTAGQSVRVNAGGTAWEAYTPGSGLSWGASVNGATGTGVALAMDNSYASGGIGQSIIAGNTQTNALIGMKIDMGTSALNHSGIIVNGLRSATSNGDGSDEGLIKINSYTSLTQLVGHTTGLKIGRFLNSNSAFDHVGIEVEARANSSTGKNTGIIISNLQTSFTPGFMAKGTGISLTQSGTGGTTFAVYGHNNSNSSTGIINYTLSNTQSGATVFQKIDLGTSTQNHTGLLVNAYNASSSCVGVKIDGSTTATGYGLEFAGVGASGYARIRFSNQLVPAGGSSIGINFSSSLSATTGTGVGIQFGSVSGGGSGTARAIYCPTLADNTGGGTGVLIQVDNLIGATSTTAPTSAKYYSFNNNQSAVLANLSVDPSEILFSRTCTRTTGTTTDNFNLSYLKRTSIQNGVGGTFSTTGSVQKLENVATQTAGTLTDSTTVLSLVQDNDSTGGHILFNSYSGSPTTDGIFWFDGTNFKARVGGATKTFTIT